MPKFGSRSSTNLATCRSELQEIANEAIKYIDFTVIEGHRNREKQDEAYHAKRSQLKFPQSKHNTLPSDAFDLAPYPIDWNDTRRFIFLAGIIKGIAWSMGFDIRWGGDWDGDGDFSDQTFNDLPHFEFVETKQTKMNLQT